MPPVISHFIAEEAIQLFESIPGNNLLIAPDPPLFTILGVTNGYLEVIGKDRQELIGRGMFEVFPANPDDLTDTGETDLRSSFYKVIRQRKVHALPTHRYDVTNSDGSFEKRYWNARNTPCFDKDGEVRYIVHSAVEITDQVKLQEQKDHSRLLEQAHNMFMQAPLAIAILTGERLIVEMANAPLIEVWGKGPDIIGKPITEVLPEIGSQGFLGYMKEVVATGKPFHAYEMPVTLLRKGVEELVYFNFAYQPYYVKENTGPIGIIIFATEVTEQVTSRNQMQISDDRIRILVESAPFPIGVYVGKEMRIELANQSIIDGWGKGSDVIGKLYTELLPELENQEIFRHLEEVYTTGKPFHEQNRRFELIVDGIIQPSYYNYSLTPLFDLSGKIYGVMNTAANVTDLAVAKQKEVKGRENLHNIILQAPVAMCILNGSQFIVEIANDRMIEMWGKTAGEVNNKPLFKGLPEAREQGIEALMEHVFITGETFKAMEMPVNLPRNGKIEKTYINFVYEPFYEAEGKITGIIAVAIEVTDQVLARRKIEDIVTQRTKELAEANAALTRSNVDLKRSNVNLAEFAYAASHDLKEPIRKIHFFGDRIKNSMSDRMNVVEKQFFERMEVAAKRMGSLIDDLLNFSQVSLRPAAFEDVDLNDVINLVLSDLDLEIEQKKALIEVNELCTVQGHPRQLQQAFQNLLANALKYCKPDLPPHISIKFQQQTGIEEGHLSPDTSNEKFCMIEIADNGIGFEQKDAERIFNVFTRLHGNFEFRGTGLGLSIVRKVMENHNGYVTAQSEVGKGSVFRLYLPV
jgi:PAS domain S-box-containing protein